MKKYINIIYNVSKLLIWSMILLLFAVSLLSLYFKYVLLNFFEPIPSINYLYLYSTIAQTFGAFIAVLAVFLIFRLETINNKIENIHEKIYLKIKPLLDIEYEKTIENAESLLHNGVKDDLQNEIKFFLERYKYLLSKRKGLIKQFAAPASQIVLLIFLSCYIIPWIPKEAYVTNVNISIFSVLFAIGVTSMIIRLIIFIYKSLVN